MIDFQIGPTGIWFCPDVEPHTFDAPLAEEISSFFLEHNARHVLDVGCGSGAYVAHLRRRGIVAIGVDGNPSTSLFCDDCKVMDLTVSFGGLFGDWVLCLEVGEHLPRQYEADFLRNLERACGSGVILSWFPYDGEGIGHVNPRPNQYIAEKMMEFGFESNNEATDRLRKSATQWWFQNSLMVFQRA